MRWWWGPLCTRPTRLGHADRHVTPPGHIILILSQPVFALSPSCCVLSGEARDINFIVFGLTRSALEITIYRTRVAITLPMKFAMYYTVRSNEAASTCDNYKRRSIPFCVFSEILNPSRDLSQSFVEGVYVVLWQILVIFYIFVWSILLCGQRPLFTTKQLIKLMQIVVTRTCNPIKNQSSVK